MKRKIKYHRLVWLKHDLPAGLIVFLVALPLCMGIALASGAPLSSGILSGIIGGLVVSVISNSQLGVSGPAAGLSTVVAAAIISLGGFQVFLLAVIVAGLFQLLLGIFKLGGIANYFPSAVIKGMLAAIGIILISKQIPLALGYDLPNFWTGGFAGLFATTDFFGNIAAFGKHFSAIIILVSVISLLVIIYYKKFSKVFKIIPAPLLVVIIGILFVVLGQYLPLSFDIKNDQLVNVPSNIFAGFQFPDFSLLFSNFEIWQSGLVIGLLATIETLLCVEAVDKLDKQNRITPVNRELIAQGIGNITCGIFGAIPMTAVVVRGAANADAGARTKLSAFTHGLFLLLAVMLIPFVLNKIPYASLAAILIITGYNLAKPAVFVSMWKLGLKQFLPFIVTILMILFTDLLIGVCIGLLLSIYFIIQNNFKDEFKITESKSHETNCYLVHLNSNVTFLNKVKLKLLLDKIPQYSVVTIDGSATNFIDYDILEIISEFTNKAKVKHIELHLLHIKMVEVTASSH